MLVLFFVYCTGQFFAQQVYIKCLVVKLVYFVLLQKGNLWAFVAELGLGVRGHIRTNNNTLLECYEQHNNNTNNDDNSYSQPS